MEFVRNFLSSQPSVRASKRRAQQTCTWMNTEIALRHIGHGSPFLVSTSAQSPHANWCPQGTATCDLVPMKQMEHVVPPPKVEVSSAMVGRAQPRWAPPPSVFPQLAPSQLGETTPGGRGYRNN